MTIYHETYGITFIDTPFEYRPVSVRSRLYCERLDTRTGFRHYQRLTSKARTARGIERAIERCAIDDASNGRYSRAGLEAWSADAPNAARIEYRPDGRAINL